MITSTHNKRVARAVRLKKRAIREKDRRFLLEGIQGVGEALASRARLHDLFFDSAEGEGRLADVLQAAAGSAVAPSAVSPDVMAHLTSTVTPQGVVAVAEFVDVPLEDLAPDGIVAILSEVRDPGNAGTILRSADASGAGGVVFTRSSVDVYNTKAVRATAGSLFHVPVVRDAEVAEAVRSLRERGFRVLAAAADGGATVYETDLTGPVAILFGNEAHGLSSECRALADGTIRVPIVGRAESLNLAAAATVTLFEAARQRVGGDPLAQIVAGAAHDIRSPLTAMRGFISTMLSRWERLDDEQRRMMLEGVVHDGFRMGIIITQLVEAARLTSRAVELSPARVDLLAAARAACEEAAAGPDIQTELSGGQVTVMADPTRLKTIVVALIEAAKWWGEEGPVHVEVTGDPSPEVRVWRSGSTLETDQEEVLFLPRAPGSGAGSKVGLFVARGLAEYQGGRVEARAEGDVSFRLILPPSS